MGNRKGRPSALEAISNAHLPDRPNLHCSDLVSSLCEVALNTRVLHAKNWRSQPAGLAKSQQCTQLISSSLANLEEKVFQLEIDRAR